MYNDDQPRKKALVDALGGADDPSPLGMPGSVGNPNTGIGGAVSAPPLQADAPAPIAAPSPFQRNDTRLMEGDAGKLANVDHAKKSPKYDFLQLANQGKYGYDQLGDLLKELQGGPNASHWQGWSADKDKLRFGGDKAQLGDAWQGVTEVDAIGGFNSGNPQGFRWGAGSDGSGPGEPQAQGGGINAGRPSFAGSTISPMLQGDAQANIQAALQNIGGMADGSRLQELIKALGGQV
jgi:hypothetical protein